MTTSNTKVCCVCKKIDSSYRCPACSQCYCSLGCCKQHKNDCKTIAEPINIQKPIEKTPNASNFELLTADQINKLNNSEYVNSMISSKRLSTHILNIDSSSNKQETLKKIRQSSIEFEEFIQKMLQEITTNDLA